MTKIELLRQYIGDLKMHVPESPGRDNRIAVLEEELEHEQLQNKSSNSDCAKLPNIDELKSYMHKHKYLPNIIGTLEAIKKLGNFA